ncbi:hypothetical protein HN371_14400 [Candidatus Poribacteria bacterium]|jgi:hypothetical protein|nr:hypothetical protein [Candidatus Poribacteria bacterium]MBT5713809.1 hypothetical protein [Candidatus Poribacteria bacterium]MBT7806505.1 hypothetical protein [Candidatus Poribacteria bacterium]
MRRIGVGGGGVASALRCRSANRAVGPWKGVSALSLGGLGVGVALVWLIGAQTGAQPLLAPGWVTVGVCAVVLAGFARQRDRLRTADLLALAGLLAFWVADRTGDGHWRASPARTLVAIGLLALALWPITGTVRDFVRKVVGRPLTVGRGTASSGATRTSTHRTHSPL